MRGRAVGSITEVTMLRMGISGILWPQVLRRLEKADLKYLLKILWVGIDTAVMDSLKVHIDDLS